MNEPASEPRRVAADDVLNMVCAIDAAADMGWLELQLAADALSERGTRIDAANNTLYLSKLFDWFKGDFEYKSGSVLNFIKPYLNEKTLAFLQRDPQIAYLDYDWALNAQEPLK